MNLQIKKYWLLSSILYFISLLVDGFANDPYLRFEFTFFFLTFVIPFGYLFIETLNFVGLFLFSYKKNGTVLLTMNMVLSICRMFVVTCPLWFWKEFLAMYAHANRTVGHLLIDLLTSTLYFTLILQWFVFSFKLRSANKLARMNEILLDPEYQKLLQELQAVNNLDELSLKYGTSVRNYPQIAGTLKKIYKQRTLDLSKS